MLSLIETVTGWYDAMAAWVDAAFGPIILVGITAVLVIGCPFFIWSAIRVRRRGVAMQARVLRQIRESVNSRSFTPEYELLEDPDNVLTRQYAGLVIRGIVSSGVTARQPGAVVNVHYDPQTQEIISIKDQWLTPIFGTCLWLIGLFMAYSMIFDPTYWDGL